MDVGRRPSVVCAEAETLPFPQPSPTTTQRGAAGSPPPNVVAPPRQNPTSRRPRDPRSSPGRTSEGNPSSLSPERLRLPRCPGNLSLGLATTASVCRGSIHRVPSPRSFSSALFFPPLFLILVFLLLYTPSSLPPPSPSSSATRPSLVEVAASPRSNPHQSSPFYPALDLVSRPESAREDEVRKGKALV